MFVNPNLIYYVVSAFRSLPHLFVCLRTRNPTNNLTQTILAHAPPTTCSRHGRLLWTAALWQGIGSDACTLTTSLSFLVQNLFYNDTFVDFLFRGWNSDRKSSRCLSNTSTFVANDRSQCLYCVFPIVCLWRSPRRWPHWVMKPMQIRWKSHVSFPVSWGRWPSLIRRNRHYIHMSDRLEGGFPSTCRLDGGFPSTSSEDTKQVHVRFNLDKKKGYCSHSLFVPILLHGEPSTWSSASPCIDEASFGRVRGPIRIHMCMYICIYICTYTMCDLEKMKNGWTDH